MSSILSIGASGLRAAEARFEASASRVARATVAPEPGAPEVDLGSELVSMQLASYDFKASAKVVEVGRDMVKSMLDMLA